MNPQTRLCQRYGSAAGCKHQNCPLDHSNPNSIPFCRYERDGKKCKRRHKCRFRHQEFAQSIRSNTASSKIVNHQISSRSTLLDGLPSSISDIIFGMVQSMECHEYSEALTFGFHQQLAWELSFDFNRPRKWPKSHRLNCGQNAFRFAESVLFSAPNHATFQMIGFGEDQTPVLSVTPGLLYRTFLSL